MPLKEFTGGGGRAHKPRISKTKAPSAKTAGKTHKAKQAKQGRAKKSAAKKAPAARLFHEQAQQSPAGAEHPSSAGLPFGGVGSSGGSTAGAAPRAVVELTGLNTTSPEGLGGAILDLVGEGKLTVAHALAAWTHEQDRLANRAWRRPGGLQRMGGL